MNHRHPHSYATPGRTGGDDRQQGACYNRPEPFDVLADLTAGPRFHAARREALAICAACPIWRECLHENRDQTWAKALMGKPTAAPSAANEGRARQRQEQHDARLADLRELIAAGANMAEVCDRLSVTRDALWKWCDRHGYRDEWTALSPPVPEAIRLRTRHRKVAA